jgi:hypothetical protein
MFRGRITMNDTCPQCQLRFEREQGYFVGAMYISYMIAVAVLSVFCALIWLIAPELSLEVMVAISAVLAIPFAPMMLRASRVLWVYFDRSAESVIDRR